MIDLDVFVTAPKLFRSASYYTLHHALTRLIPNGFSVRINRELPGNTPLAPLAFMHVDLTLLPVSYRNISAHYDRCINANVVNISKPLYSKVIVSDSNADLSGPVIVKSVLNHKGVPELKSAILQGRFGPLQNIDVYELKRRFAPDYALYASLQDVPSEVWKNRRLIVERFIPGRLQRPVTKYRHEFFFDTTLTTRGVFDSLLCAPDTIKQLEFIDDVPKEVEEVKQQLGMDFGAIDYFMTDDGVFIIDANKTTTLTDDWVAKYAEFGHFVDRMADTLMQFAQG